MTTTAMQTDDNNNPVPALGYSVPHVINGTAGAHHEIELSIFTKFFSIKTNAEICVAFGDASVEADAADHGFFAGEYEIIPAYDSINNVRKITTVSIHFVEDGRVYVSERN
jgi:hypothetical protein